MRKDSECQCANYSIKRTSNSWKEISRKVSYRFLGEATLLSNTLVDMFDNKKGMDESVSKLIENMNGQSMELK